MTDKEKKLYVIKAGDFRKVGISVEPKKRIGDIQVGCPIPCVLEASYPIPDARSMEKKVHNVLASYKTSGEWFNCSFNQIDKIVRDGNYRIPINHYESDEYFNEKEIEKENRRNKLKKRRFKKALAPKPIQKEIPSDPPPVGFCYVTPQLVKKITQHLYLTKEVVGLLGLSYPLLKGWKKSVVGELMPEENIDKLYSLVGNQSAKKPSNPRGYKTKKKRTRRYF